MNSVDSNDRDEIVTVRNRGHSRQFIPIVTTAIPAEASLARLLRECQRVCREAEVPNVTAFVRQPGGPGKSDGTGIGHATSGIGHRAPVILCPARHIGRPCRSASPCRRWRTTRSTAASVAYSRSCRAHRGARRTGALAVRTKGTAGADDATAAAVVEVSLRVHARSTAGGEPRALGHAVASHAGLRGLTDFAAGPAVARVVRDVRAHARAVGQRGRAGARSVGKTCPEAHTTPQPPQLLVSERVLTQEPPQLVRPVVQVLWQAPTEHT